MTEQQAIVKAWANLSVNRRFQVGGEQSALGQVRLIDDYVITQRKFVQH